MSQRWKTCSVNLYRRQSQLTIGSSDPRFAASIISIQIATIVSIYHMTIGECFPCRSPNWRFTFGAQDARNAFRAENNLYRHLTPLRHCFGTDCQRLNFHSASNAMRINERYVVVSFNQELVLRSRRFSRCSQCLCLSFWAQVLSKMWHILGDNCFFEFTLHYCKMFFNKTFRYIFQFTGNFWK